MPDWSEAYVPHEKLTGYLLSETHAVGKWKSELFRALGFTPENSTLLQDRLLELARTNEVTGRSETPYGTKYLIEGNLIAPNGRSIRLLTVWIVEQTDPRPRFVTAYPA